MTKIEQLLIKRGFDLDKLCKDTTVYKVTNMDLAAAAIKKAVNNNQHIHVVADYDADGVMSGCIMYLILTELGADFTIRFPKKMSEGYGISQNIVNEIPDNSLVITVDNGIAALEAIELAKTRNMNVVILDHHQIRGDNLVPIADVIVDPHIYKADGEFEDYCGAGLSYMLAKELKLSSNLIIKANVLASIATIQDVVALTDNNRNIVKYGLNILNQKAANLPGIYSLCEALKLVPNPDPFLRITEDDISFKIGPCINAMGRMLDDGAAQAFEYIMHYDIHGEDGISEIVEWNKQRKEITAKQQNILEIEAQNVLTPKTTCLVVYAPNLHEGIIGINAARLVETYNVPAIVLTNSESGLLKGSARSVDDINMKEYLDIVADHIYQYGGHAGAAGLSIEDDKLESFIKAINKVMPKSTVCKNTWQYDVEVQESELLQVLTDVRKYGPFGEGFKAPVIKVVNYNLAKNFGKYYRFIGDTGISLNGQNSEALSFSCELRDKYNKLNTPLNVNIIGSIGYSAFSKHPQIIMKDFQPIVLKQEVGKLL